MELAPLIVFTRLPVLPPPDPENVLDAVFGDMLRVSPKLTVPELLLMLTAPMIEGNDISSLHIRHFVLALVADEMPNIFDAGFQFHAFARADVNDG